MASEINIINARGENEPFSLEKVHRSVIKSGGSRQLAEKVGREIETMIYPGIKTKEIFKTVKSILKKESVETSMRFSLRDGIRNLGPAGFGFERYASEIFSSHGYAVQTNQWLKGKCVDYETDILIEKDGALLVAECKYKNRPGEKVDVGVCLKVFASFFDIKNGGHLKEKEIRPMVITNAKFTNKAKTYGQCQGVELLGWNYPEDNGLERLIESKNLYPVTVLSSFKGYFMDVFASECVMTVKDVLEMDIEKFSQKSKIAGAQLKKLKAEAELLVNN
ncbi:MAG: restriction endonuclease [Candidatus Paceibacterota bacterium]|jgi:HJR/Mrr/RecB family endonuclease|nr:restriction endonuclease [Candidatus Paceibacterota bacterium]MDD5555356.1 restriction endonuclease [Candidatus Paceibacterota bacterium]